MGGGGKEERVRMLFIAYLSMVVFGFAIVVCFSFACFDLVWVWFGFGFDLGCFGLGLGLVVLSGWFDGEVGRGGDHGGK